MAVANDKKRVAITLSKETVKQLEIVAEKYGVRKSVLASMAVTEWLEDKLKNLPNK